MIVTRLLGRLTREGYQDRAGHAINLGKTGRDRCCSKIVGVVIAIRGMVLIAFLHDKCVVCETEPTVFMATTFTCHKYQHRDISAKTVE